MTDFTKCPAGHQLPNTTAYGACSSLKCAERSVAISTAKKAKGGDALASAAASQSKDREDEKKLALAKRGYEKWAKALNVPDNLAGDEAERWADQKLANLLPVAVGVLEDQLKYGSRDEKRNAAKQILESNGRGKREALAASAPPIVIQVSGSAGVSLPWRQEKEVAGEVIPPKPDTKS